MHLLPASTIRLIASSQVITSVSSVVKELVENSLDAGASSIEIKLDGWGLGRIEVRDNGCGIKPEDAPFMAQPHYTSKLTSDNDLKTLDTYGFRGEALGALCLVCSLSVLTKAATEQVGMLYTLERSGKIEATQPKPTSTGTTVIASNLFKNLPVRKQYSSGNKRCKEELKKIEDLVMAYGLVHPSLRIILRHNKTVVWQKNKVSDHRTALLTALGTPALMQMGPLVFDDAQVSGLHIVGYLPRPGADPDVTGRAVNDRCFVYFNGRPVIMKQISQLIKQFYISHTNGSSTRFPVAFLSITMPPERLDVNLEPNKTSVMLTDKEEFMTVLTNLLEGFYSDENKITPADSSVDANSGTHSQRKEKKLTNGFHSIEESCEGIENTSSNLDAANNMYLGNVSSTPVLKDKMYTFTNLNREPLQKECLPDESDSTYVSAQTKECEITSTDVAISSVGDNNYSNGGSKSDTNTQLDKTRSDNNTRMDSSCYERTPSITEAMNDSPSRQTVQCIGHIQVSCDRLQENTNHENQADLFTSQTSSLGEHSLGDETLCNLIETELRSNASDSMTCSDKRGFQESNPDKIDPGAVVRLNADNESVSPSKSVMTSDLREAKDKSLPKNDSGSNQDNASLRSSRLNELFYIDLGDEFCDSDLDCTVANVGDKADTTLLGNDNGSANTSSAGKHVGVTGKASTVESSPVNGKLSSTLGGIDDKEWSMGRGLVDKRGHLIEPVALLTPGPPQHLQANIIMTPATPLRGKRKHPSNQENSRLSLSRKKIRKIPEITSQPLIRQLMSPNPLQRKLLSKKTDIPFCLNTLKDSVHKRAQESRSVKQGGESYHLIGRLDPWGVWLMQQGTNLVCVNQYRIQEQLLFHRLMSCHSLPKETLDHPITLSERTVGGHDCWKALFRMSSKCDPPSATRFIDDERITANGFEVCKRNDPDTGEIKVELLKVCSSIPFYGVPDLAETLGLTCGTHDRDTKSLLSCRPLKVVSYLKGEAVRVARALSSRMSRTEVNEILSRMEKQLPEGTRTCIHDRPFYETIGRV